MMRQIKAVLIDLSGTLHIDNTKIPGAVEALEKLVLDGAALIAVHKARYYRRPDGLALGPGPFVAALEYATGRRAEAVGKPEREFFHSALAELGCRPEEAVMIGDDVQQDVGGAQEAGLAGLLVRTGKYRPGDEATISPPPWHVADAFPEAVEHVLRQLELQRNGSAEGAEGRPGADQ